MRLTGDLTSFDTHTPRTRKTGASSAKKEKTITFVALALTIAVTYIAMRYLRREMEKVKHDVIYAKRRHRFESVHQ